MENSGTLQLSLYSKTQLTKGPTDLHGQTDLI